MKKHDRDLFVAGLAGLCFVVLTAIAPGSGAFNDKLELVLRIILLVGSIAIFVRGLARRELPFVIMGAALLIGAFGILAQWATWMGMLGFVAGFVMLLGKANARGRKA